MADVPMDDRQALSVLAQMELEQTQFEQQRRTITHVRGVLLAYQEALKKTADLKAQQAQMERETAAVHQRSEAETAKQSQALKAATALHEKAMADVTAQTKAAAVTLAALEADVKTKEQFLAARLAHLHDEIKAKEAALVKITTDYNEFRKQHGLGA